MNPEPVEGPALGETSSITLLMARAKEGCPESRDRVFGQLQMFIRQIAIKHGAESMAPKEGASDIVQQSCLRAIEKLETFRGATSAEFRGWLKTLVINEVRQSQRNWRRQVRDVRREQSIDATPMPLPGLPAESRETPGAHAIREEQLQAMQAAIEKLPTDYRRVVILKNFEQQSFEEIAEAMGRGVGAVTKLWYRAILKLKKQMSGDHEID